MRNIYGFRLFIFLLVIGLFFPGVASAEDEVTNQDILEELQMMEKQFVKMKNEVRELKEMLSEKEETGIPKSVNFIVVSEFYWFGESEKLFSGLTFGIENDWNRDVFSFERFLFTIGFAGAEVEHVDDGDVPMGAKYMNIREFFLRFSGDWMLLKFNNYEDVDHEYQRLSFGLGFGVSFSLPIEYTTKGVNLFSEIVLTIPDITISEQFGLEIIMTSTLAYVEVISRCGTDFEFSDGFCSGGVGFNW